MNLKHSVYESLTPKERVIATVEAIVREDEKEITRLIETCPIKHYRQADIEYSGTMDSLVKFSVAIESDLMSAALSYLTLALHGHEVALQFLQILSDTEETRRRILKGLGVSDGAMDFGTGTRHPLVACILKDPPVPDEVAVGKMYDFIMSKAGFAC